MLKALPSLLLLSLAAPSPAQDFWDHWGDGKAELNGYALKQPRYGAVRTGTSVLIFVTEDFSDTLRVKADPGKHPASDVYPVMKLNAVRDFPTGIYDYNVMTSAFLRVAPGWPVAKVSFSSQEWCGHVWHQLVPRDGKLGGPLPQLLRRRGGRGGRPRVPEGRRLRGRAAGPPPRLERRLPEAGGEPHGAVPAEPPLGAPQPQAARVDEGHDRARRQHALGHRAGGSLRRDRLHRGDGGRAQARLRDRGGSRPTG